MAAISFSVRGHFSYCKVSIFLDQKLQAIAFAGRSSLGLWMPQKRCICFSVAFLACSLIDRQIASYFAFLFCFWAKQGYWLFFLTGWLVSWGLSSTFFQLIDVFVYKTFLGTTLVIRFSFPGGFGILVFVFCEIESFKSDEKEPSFPTKTF